MPIGPPEDPDRFEDFDECVAALMDDDHLSKDEAKRICGSWENAQNHAMTDTDDEPQHRAYHQPSPDQVIVREDDNDGVFTVRMPIASTGEVRNEGDDPLGRDELAGMAEQIELGSLGVFIDHGKSHIGGAGGMFGNAYSALGKVGVWEDPDVTDSQDTDGPALLEASARLMDPETLPDETGVVREALASLKSQMERNIPLSSSIGWREDESAPGGNDLMEASIVGIPADPRTVSDNTAAVARAAVEAGADPEELLEQMRAVVMGPDTTNDSDVSTDTDTSDEQSEDTTDEQDGQRDAPEWAEELLEQQRKQTELLNEIGDAVREDDDDDDDEDDEDDDDDENGTQSDSDSTQSDDAVLDEIQSLREDLQDATAAVREDDDDDDDEDRNASVTNSTDTTDDLLKP